MADPDGPTDHDRPEEPPAGKSPKGNTEDTAFPEWYRNFWRTLLGPWGRR